MFSAAAAALLVSLALVLVRAFLGPTVVSLENLMTYPWIAQRVATGTVHLHGWYFDIAEGELLCYNPARNAFEPVAADPPDPPGSTS